MIKELSRATEDIRFRGAVSRSWVAVYMVADHYRNLGYDVTLPPYSMRPTFDGRAGYGDAEDLLVAGRWRVEVKWRGIKFTCASDYPYRTVFVDRADKADVCEPHAYFAVSEDLNHFAVIKGSTKPLWVKSARFDKIKGYPLQVYECPVWAAHFVSRAHAD